jgi:glycosyltransferase involved in cell wall biosynthesis
MGCNTPVIGTRIGAIPEVLTGVTPELIAPDPGPESLMEKMRFFINNIENYNSKVRRHDFSRYAHDNYSWDKTSQRIIDALSEIS